MALTGMNHWQRAVLVAGVIVFVVAVMGGLLAAAVGGGGSLAVAADATTHGRVPAQSSSALAASTSSTGSTNLPASVKAQAERSLLKLSDLSQGWAASASAAATTHASPFSKKLATCADVPTHVASVKATKLNSPDFTSSDHTLAVEDSISVFPNAAEAKAAYRALASAKTPACMNRIGSQALRASVQNEAGSGATVGSVTIAALAPGTYEAGQTGYSVTIPLVSSGRELTITSTNIEFVRGRFVHQLTFNGNGVTFPALLQVHLIRQVEARSS